MTLVSSLTSMAANVWNYFSIPHEPLWQRAMDEVGYREYLAFESSVRANLKSIEEQISNKTILPQTLRTILLNHQEQLDKYISPYFYDKKLKRLQDKLDCPKAFMDVLEESRARLKEKLATKPLIAKQSFYNDVINHLIKLSANLDLHVINADDLADVINYYQGIIPAEIFEPIKAAVENNPITDQKNIEVVLKTVNAFFFGDKTEIFSAISNSVDQFQSRPKNLKLMATALAWSYVGAARAQEMGVEFLKVFGGNGSDLATTILISPADEIILGGSTDSFSAGMSDGFLSMSSVNGSFVRARRFGGLNDDFVDKIKMTPTDEILVAGDSKSVGAGREDFWLSKFSLADDFIWSRTLGGNLRETMEDMELTPEEEIMLVGFTTSFGAGLEDVLIVNTDDNGLPIWSRSAGGNRSDYGRAVVVDPITGKRFILADSNSFSFGAGYSDILFIVFDPDGALHCACTFGGSRAETGTDILLTPNGDILVLGFTNSVGVAGGGWDILIGSVTENCIVNEVRTIGRSGNDFAHEFMYTHLDKLFVVGFSDSASSVGFVLEIFANGPLDWAHTLIETVPAQIFSVAMAFNNETFIAGRRIGGDLLLAKLDTGSNKSDCNLTRPFQLTVLDWINITVKNVTSEINITIPTLTVYNWTDMQVQAFVPEEYFSCPNNSMAATSSSPVSESTVSSTSQNSQATTSAPSSSSSSNNPTSSTSSQAGNTINFTVQVSPEIILIESDSDPIIVLSSTHLSVIGDIELSNVIYTVSGNMPDWVTIYVDGVIVTQFTQEDVEGNFVSFELNGVACGDQYSLPLKVNGADVDADLIFQMDTCSTDNAPRVSDGFLISSKMLPIFGFLARTREQPTRSPECSEAEPGKGFPVFR